MNDLNPQQKEVAETLDGALLVIAGAGTGKTHVIVERIANMLEHGISGSSILAVTFTNKAAREMLERIEKRCGTEKEQSPTMCTFHSFCLSVLHHFIHLLGFKNNFTIATEGYQKGLLREIAVELNLAGSNVDPYTWLSRISLAKAYLESPDDMARKPFKDSDKISQIYRRYQERLKRMNMVDFDDLLTLTVRLWEEHPDVLRGYQERYRYVMIDEYQDTNRAQFRLIQLLVGDNGNICAVGDDDQSIYGWRGANQENILDFEKHFPGAKVIRLEQNYRSTNTILKTANALIAKNRNRRPKNLWSAKGEGDKIQCVTLDDAQAEADFIADTIYNTSSAGKSLLSMDRDWRRFAILYRASSLSRLIETSLRRRHIPFQVVGSTSFYQRKEILDVLTMLELALNPANDMALMRVINVPPRGIGDASLDALSEKRDITHHPMFTLALEPEYLSRFNAETASALKLFASAIIECGQDADKPGSIYGRVSNLLSRLNYMDKLIQMYKPREDALKRKENVEEFLTSVAEYDLATKNQGTLKDFVSKVALQDSSDKVEKDKQVTQNAVHLMTVHASKGLEFPVVFLPGLEENTFPHERALKENSLEEERRLFYVAVTRAKERLYISHVNKRFMLNSTKVKRISRFLMDIPDEFCEIVDPKVAKVEMTEEDSLDYLAQIRKMINH